MEGYCGQTFEGRAVDGERGVMRAVVPTGAGVTRTWKADMKQV